MNIEALSEKIFSIKQQPLYEFQKAQLLGRLLNDYVSQWDNVNALADLGARDISKGLYRRYRLNAPQEDFHVIVAFWGANSHSPIHDHDATTGAVVTVLGELVETKYQRIMRLGSRWVLQPQDQLSMPYGLSSPIRPDDATQLHKMSNLTSHLAASLHVYLHPLHRFHTYEPSRSGLHHIGLHKAIQRELWFDEVRTLMVTR